MLNFLHTYNPEPILYSFGPLTIYWYGFFIVIGAVFAILSAINLAGYYKIDKENIIDLAFYLIIFGIIGARIYHIILEWPYYYSNPINILKVWNGGLAIHGAIIAGVLVVYWFARKKNLNFWFLTSLVVPGLALAQAIGRWGNYFNQELFGKPTHASFGIPINIMNRPVEFISSDYFQPTFLYESIGNFVIFLTLIGLHIWTIRKNKQNDFNFFIITSVYLILYSILRFVMEFIRIDITPELFGLRFPQIASLIIVLLTIGLIIYKIRNRKSAQI